MHVETRYFGTLDFEESSLLRFPSGVPGFEDEKEFVTIEIAESRPLVFLQSTRTPSLCWITLPVQTIAADYRARLSREDREALRLECEEVVPGPGLMILVMVSEGERATANLLAPVVVHVSSGLAVQSIQYESGYSHRHEIEGIAPGGPKCS